MFAVYNRGKLFKGIHRGSGLRKIVDQFPEDAAPSFRSTEQSFVVTMRNLNYGNISSPLGDEVGVDDGDDIDVTIPYGHLDAHPQMWDAFFREVKDSAVIFYAVNAFESEALYS